MVDTERLIRALIQELPNMIKREEDGRAAIRAIFAEVANGLMTLEPVRLEGVGEFIVHKDSTPPRIEFTPEKELQEAMAAAVQK